MQSGSDRVLALMKRGHTALEYKQKIRRLREVRPDISISSDFIVGFPGETERDFEATMDLIAEIGFDQSFSFIYSRRPGTPAASLPDDVDHAVKQQRLAVVAGADQSAGHARSAVTWSAAYSACWWSGHRRKIACSWRAVPRTMRWVNFDGPASLIGGFVDVLITEALPNSLRGRLADRSRAA